MPAVYDPEELASAENAAKKPETSEPVQHENPVGIGYTGGGQPPRRRLSLRGRLSRRQKLFGLVGLTAGGGIIAFILFFLPFLRLESYLASINQRVFAGVSHAVSERTQHLFERYMITHAINLHACKGKITTTCRADYSKMGPAGALFNTWRDAKIEQKLIQQYDLKFETRKNPSTGQYRITIRSGKTGDVIRLTEGQVAKGQFTGGRREFGREINKFLLQETRWYDVMQRRSVRKYLARKHGVIFWCFFACKHRDTIDNKFKDAKTRMRYRLIERTIYPFSPKLGFIMQCITSGDSGKGGGCTSKALRQQGIDRSTLSNEEIENIRKHFTGGKNPRMSSVLTERLIAKILSAQAGRAAVSTIPVAGQIYLAAVVIDMLDRMDEFIDDNGLSKFAADINSRQYLEFYTAMRSVNDEMKAGAKSVSEVGAVMSEFGGDYPAETSLVYRAYNSPSSSTASLFDSKVYATSHEAQKKDPYLCADGKSIPKGELVCPEKKVARTFKIEDWRNNSLVDGLADILNKYRCSSGLPFTDKCVPGPRLVVRPFLGVIDKIANTILGPGIELALKGLRALPGAGSIISYAESKVEGLFQAFFQKVFPLPVQVDSTGREKYDGLEAGGEVAASEFGKGGYTEGGQAYGLGGKKLSSEEQVAIWQEYIAQQNYDYQHSSLFTKFTSLEHPNSLANRFIAAMPRSLDQIPQRFIAFLANPFDNFLAINQSAYAGGALLTESPFGIPRFGYAVDDPAITRDPAELTEKFCEDAKQKWEASMKEDALTGIDEYYVTNPCLLEQVAVEAASSAFIKNDSLDDTIVGNQNEQPSEGAPPSGSAQQTAQQILQAAKAGRIKFNVLHSADILDSSTPEQNIQQTANGQPAHTTSTCGISGRGAQPPVNTVALDINLLKFVLELSQAQNVQVNAIAGQCHSTTTSNHYRGKAVDFGCPFDTFTADRIGTKYSVSRNNESCADFKGPHYHYSVGGG